MQWRCSVDKDGERGGRRRLRQNFVDYVISIQSISERRVAQTGLPKHDWGGLRRDLLSPDPLGNIFRNANGSGPSDETRRILY